MMVSVYGLDGKKASEVELPEVFRTEVRDDLIKRAVISLQSHRLQPYGPNWFSGKDTSAFSFGTGRGMSKIPRVTGGGPVRGRGSIVPQAVPERNLVKKINKKEQILSTASAIAATAKKDLVESRGHNISGVYEFPIVVVDDFERLSKTKDVNGLFSSLGLDSDLSRAKIKSIRSGKGTKRGRKYKKRKSVLVVVSKDENIRKAAENLSGVDVTTARNLNAEHLAPGANPARLTVYTESALKDLENRFKGVF
jgi:large subunit ribosomal protein L4e